MQFDGERSDLDDGGPRVRRGCLVKNGDCWPTGSRSMHAPVSGN